MLAGVGFTRLDLFAAASVQGWIERWPPAPFVTPFLLSVGTTVFFAGVCRWTPATRFGAWVERLGERPAAFSYTLYLTHFPVLLCLSWLTVSLPPVLTWYSVSRLCGWMTVCGFVAWAMYLLFEAQTPRVRGRLRALLGRRTSAAEPTRRKWEGARTRTGAI